MSLILISSPRFADHTPPPGHPESPERADVFDVVAARWHTGGGVVVDPRPATDDELRRVHTAEYVNRIEATAGRAAMLDPDTYTSPESAELARLAAGAALTGLEWILTDLSTDSRRALALVRPPGHHAEADRAMGFCLYNNVAVAAADALARGLARVAIVDYDVHHGNATQHMFERDPRVLFVSLHQYPFYPGTGAVSEVGLDEGAGCTVNVPLDAGATDGDYALVFDRVVTPVLEEFAPELLLVSAGFDAHERDPLGQMRVTHDGFAHMTARLVEIADRFTSGRLLAVTEGGYDRSALRESLERVIGVLAAEAAPGANMAVRASTGRAERAIEAVRAAQSGRWRGL